MYNRYVKFKGWYGWMGYCFSLTLDSRAEVILGIRWQPYTYVSEAGWSSITYGFISLQWDSSCDLIEIY